MNTFGNRLKSRRIECGFQRQELAKRLGVCVNSIGQWERGLCVPQSLDVLQNLASLLDVSVAYFFDSLDHEDGLKNNPAFQDLKDRVTRLERSLDEESRDSTRSNLSKEL